MDLVENCNNSESRWNSNGRILHQQMDSSPFYLGKLFLKVDEVDEGPTEHITAFVLIFLAAVTISISKQNDYRAAHKIILYQKQNCYCKSDNCNTGRFNHLQIFNTNFIKTT